MMKNRGKKSLALLGGVMMLLNMALPGFTYAGGESASSVALEVKVMPYEPDLDLRLESWGDLCENPIVKLACNSGNDQCPEQCKDGGSDFQWEDITDKVPPFAVQDEKYKTSSLDSNFKKMRVKLEKDGEEFTKEFTPSDIEADIIKVDLSTTVNRLKELNPLAQSNFEVNYNTSEEDAKKVLPSKATITDTAEAEHQVDLTWTVDGYKADIAGDYTAIAHFTLPEGVKQSKPETELQYTAKITVKADPLVEKKAKVDALKILVDNQVELAEQVVYLGKNGMNSLNWSNETPLGELEPQTCILKGADEALYDRHAGSGDTFNESFAKCSGLLTPSKYRSYAFPRQQYTLTVDFGDEIKKVYRFKFERLSDLAWKTDYDPSKSTNPNIKNFRTARQGTPFVDIKNKDDAKLSNLLGFLYTINAPNLDLSEGNNVGYTITLGDKVIAYGALRNEQPITGMFQWSFRDWSTSAAYTAEETKYDADNFYHDGPAGNALDDVEGSNETILKAGDKVTILVKIKLADGKEASITQDYVITAQDVINAQYGVEKLTLTLKDGDVELGKQTVLSGTAAEKPADPKKENFTFKGWFADAELKNAFDFASILDEDTTLYAKWEEVKQATPSSTSSSGRGGGSSSSPSKTSVDASKTPTQTTPATETTKATDAKSLEALTKEFAEANKADTTKVEALAQALASVQKSSVAQELKNAYTYAYLRGITTQPSIEKTELQRGLTRAEMAKMMSVFATKVLGKKVMKTDSVQYADVKMECDLPRYIQLAYQLQIMGIDAKGNAIANFNPNVEVSRAEFATVLSRVLYGDKYNQEGADFASKHLSALKDADILKDTNPQMKELRGWVMLMLQRAEGVK